MPEGAVHYDSSAYLKSERSETMLVSVPRCGRVQKRRPARRWAVNPEFGAGTYLVL